MRITYPTDSWGVDLTREQLAIGEAEARKPGATQFSVWSALKDAGVPVRDPDNSNRAIASLAATIIRTALVQ